MHFGKRSVVAASLDCVADTAHNDPLVREFSSVVRTVAAVVKAE
jgi:hypothetical protein